MFRLFLKADSKVIIQRVYNKIYSEKPDIFGSFPDVLLDIDTVNKLREIPFIVLGEIYNGDSFDSTVGLLAKMKPDAFLPTISYTGTEYGCFKNLKQHLKLVKNIVEKDLGIYCAEPVFMGSPKFWWALNGRFRNEVRNRFGDVSTCAGCRLYSFALRVPLCKKIGAKTVIPGDIISDPGNTDYFFSNEAIMCYTRFMASFGIELCYPYMNSGERPCIINNEKNNERLFRCVFQSSHSVEEPPEQKYSSIRKYFEIFAVPATAKILSRVLCDTVADYEKLVFETLMPVDKKVKTRKSRR